MRFSVIIPIYNAEKTLKRCLDSLVKQLPEDSEIILINDGSTDNSEEIAQRYAAAHQNIHYHWHTNSGVSYTRNVGLSLALGEYILFVDSDDYVTDEYFSVIRENCAEHPDLLLYGFYLKGNILTNGTFSINTSSELYQQANILFRNCNMNSVWSKAFRKDIIEKNQIRFDQTLAIGEDLAFVFSYFLHIHSLKSAAEPIYCVDIEDTNSLSRKKRDYLCNQLYELHSKMFQRLEQSALSEQDKSILNKGVEWTYYRSLYSISKELFKYDLKYSQRLRKIGEACDIYRNNRTLPKDKKALCIALPIHLKLTWVIDCLSGIADWSRKHQ